MANAPGSRQKGIALTVAIMTILLMSLLGSAVLMLAYNQARLARAGVGGRTKAFYRAQAGLVDARERMHNGSCPACKPAACARCDSSCGGFAAACPYETAALNPAPYTLDVDGSGTADTTVDIGPVNAATGLRNVVSRGSEF